VNQHLQDIIKILAEIVVERHFQDELAVPDDGKIARSLRSRKAAGFNQLKPMETNND
jgi:hypothetical protein